MSFYRENVTWQTDDGHWRVGFYRVIEPDFEDRDEDWDPEWDVDYDDTSFEDVYTGTSQEAAWAEVDADRPNPGGSMVYRHRPEHAAAIAEFEAMAADLRARQAAEEPIADQPADEPADAPEAEQDTVVTATGSAYLGRRLEEVAFDAIGPGDLLLNSPDGTAGDDEYEIIRVGADAWRVVESQLPPLPEGWAHFAHEVGYTGDFQFIRLYRLA